MQTNHLQNIFLYQNSCKIYHWMVTMHLLSLLQAQHRELKDIRAVLWLAKSGFEGYHSMPVLNSDFCSMKELEALLIPVSPGWDANPSEITFGILLGFLNK